MKLRANWSPGTHRFAVVTEDGTNHEFDEVTIDVPSHLIRQERDQNTPQGWLVLEGTLVEQGTTARIVPCKEGETHGSH